LWGKKNEERIKVSRHKDYDYFMNVIDVAQDIKQSVVLIINYPFLILVYIWKKTALWTSCVSNALLSVKCIIFFPLTYVIHRTS